MLLREEYNPSMQLDGKIVVATGASMGIGEAIAKRFAAEGASVVMLSRDTARAEAARGRIGFADRTVALSCDVRHSEEIDRVLALTLHHFKRVDIWINNAGHGLMDSVAEVELPAARELFETNVFGALYAMQAVVPVMRQQGGGCIINISSVAGHIPIPFHAIYNAVRGSEVATVRPQSVRGISPERVAQATLQGYLKSKREVIVPWTMHAPVKLYQLFPSLVEWAMGRMAK